MVPKVTKFGAHDDSEAPWSGIDFSSTLSRSKISKVSGCPYGITARFRHSLDGATVCCSSRALILTILRCINRHLRTYLYNTAMDGCGYSDLWQDVQLKLLRFYYSILSLEIIKKLILLLVVNVLPFITLHAVRLTAASLTQHKSDSVLKLCNRTRETERTLFATEIWTKIIQCNVHMSGRLPERA